MRFASCHLKTRGMLRYNKFGGNTTKKTPIFSSSASYIIEVTDLGGNLNKESRDKLMRLPIFVKTKNKMQGVSLTFGQFLFSYRFPFCRWQQLQD